MEVKDLARAVLFGATLDDKLTTFDRLTDDDPGAPIDVPDRPARPDTLALVGGEAAPFPTTAAFESDRMRGRALHFFANHELLAAELMALCLLRFVDAPKKFRLGLAQTIADEQRHLALYRARMESLGVGLGEVGVNDFFWRVVKDAPTPADFVARMSLTFEQANLDFSKHFADVFAAVGDEETAGLMQVVYEDEIRHVRHGVRWFDEWRKDESLWTAHTSRLVRPLSAMRAKGQPFDREGRRRAGLPDAYIERLRLHRGSKGRTPRVWLFNATAEEEVLHGDRYTPPAGAAAAERDLAFVMAYLARPEDVVLAERPSDAFLATLLDAGFEIPTIAPSLDDVQESSALVPWGESPRAARVRERLSLEPVEAPSLFDKRRFAKLMGATVCTTLDEVRAAVRGPSVIKSVFGASGRHQRVVRDLDDNTIGFVRQLIERAGAVLVEPHHQRVRDFGVLLDVGRSKPFGPVYETIVDNRGAYRGHRFRPPATGLGAPARVGFFKQLRRAAEDVARELTAANFEGPAGFDAYAHTDGDAVRLRLVNDVNARLTMGHVARALFRNVAKGSTAEWRHVRAADARREGLELGPWIQRWTERNPVTVRDGRIESGAIATTDPSLVTTVGTILVVSRPDTSGARDDVDLGR